MKKSVLIYSILFFIICGATYIIHNNNKNPDGYIAYYNGVSYTENPYEWDDVKSFINAKESQLLEEKAENAADDNVNRYETWKNDRGKLTIYWYTNGEIATAMVTSDSSLADAPNKEGE